MLLIKEATSEKKTNPLLLVLTLLNRFYSNGDTFSSVNEKNIAKPSLEAAQNSSSSSSSDATELILTAALNY